MEGLTTFELLTALTALLFVALIWQRRELQKLNSQLTEAHRLVAQRANRGTQSSLALLERAPLPAWFISCSGSIEYQSRSALELVPGASSAQDISRFLGHRLPEPHGVVGQQHPIIVKGASGDLRHFMLVNWPVYGKRELLGHVYVCIEQTVAVTHRLHRQTFENELLALQANLIKELAAQDLSPTLIEHLTGLGRLTHTLQVLLRAPSGPGSGTTDLVRLSKLSGATLRSSGKKQRLAITLTLPRQLEVRGNTAELQRTLECLQEGILELAAPDSTVRIHVSTTPDRAILAFHVPLSKSDLPQKDFFQFSAQPIQYAHALFAAARLLASHQHIQLTAKEDDGVLELALSFRRVRTR